MTLLADNMVKGFPSPAFFQSEVDQMCEAFPLEVQDAFQMVAHHDFLGFANGYPEFPEAIADDQRIDYILSLAAKTAIGLEGVGI